MQADVLVLANCVLAGVALCAGLMCLGIARLDRTMRDFPAMAALAGAMTVQLVSGAVVLGGHGTATTTYGGFLRAVASMTAAILAVYISGRLVPRLPTRRVVQALVVVAVLRAAVWLPTDLIVRHPYHGNGPGAFGPLGFTWIAFVIGPAVTSVLALRHVPPIGRWIIGGWLVAYLAFSSAPGLVDSRVVFEELVTLNVLPGGIAILALAALTVVRGARNRDLLAHRQQVFARVGRAAMYESVDSLRLSTESRLREELGHDVLFVLLTERTADNAIGTSDSRLVRVVGRRQVVSLHDVPPLDDPTLEFVESLLRIVVAAADRADADAEFAHRVRHDDLTGLPTLALLETRLDERLHLNSPSDVLLVLCRVGRMGRTLATEGLDHGNAVIAAVGAALDGLRRPGTFVARMSSDHFAVLENLPSDDPDGFLVERLRQIRAAAEIAADGVVHVGAVLGRPESTTDTMLRDAATAVERSRAEGRTFVFDEELAAQLRQRVDLERDLANALDRDELEVRYQPIVDVRTRATIGYEALARWQHGDTVVPAGTWVPLAERSGLIHRIGRHILSIAARDQPRLGVPVAVNVSPLELREADFVDDVLQALGDRCPELITLEITESAMMSDLDHSIAALQELRALGMRVALDDFGSSYSSLGALADLPIDILKLDRSFVSRLGTPGGLAVVQATVTLAHALDKPIVAEGVETEEQRALLAGLGVDRLQGYLLGRPVSVARVATGRTRPVPGYSSSVR